MRFVQAWKSAEVTEGGRSDAEIQAKQYNYDHDNKYQYRSGSFLGRVALSPSQPRKYWVCKLHPIGRPCGGCLRRAGAFRPWGPAIRMWGQGVGSFCEGKASSPSRAFAVAPTKLGRLDSPLTPASAWAPGSAGSGMGASAAATEQLDWSQSSRWSRKRGACRLRSFSGSPCRLLPTRRFVGVISLTAVMGDSIPKEEGPTVPNTRQASA